MWAVWAPVGFLKHHCKLDYGRACCRPQHREQLQDTRFGLASLLRCELPVLLTDCHLTSLPPQRDAQIVLGVRKCTPGLQQSGLPLQGSLPCRRHLPASHASPASLTVETTTRAVSCRTLSGSVLWCSARDNQGEECCLGRQRSPGLHDPEPHQVLSAQRGFRHHPNPRRAGLHHQGVRQRHLLPGQGGQEPTDPGAGLLKP